MVQGGGDSPTLTQAVQQLPPANLAPSDKFEYVKELRNRPMRVGETWFVISRQWYRRWEMACQGILDKSGPVEEHDVSPVDNTPLVDRDGNLTSNSVEGVDVEFVPEEAWKAFITWLVGFL